MDPTSRRRFLVETLYALLLAVFPGLRRKKLVRSDAGAYMTPEERFVRDCPPFTAWRFGDGEVHWEVRKVGS